MHWIGPLLTTMAVLYAGLLGAQTYAPYGAETAMGIALGASALAAMSMTLALSTRPSWLEPLFGGLDRMYGVHKWLGIAALGLMLGHNTIEPELEDVVRETRLGEIAADVGELAFNGFIGLILISWFKRIPLTKLELPWPIWRFTHRFTGLLFAVAAFHQLAIDQPGGLDGRLSLYLNTLSVIGIGAWLFTQFIAPFMRQRHFVVDALDAHGSILSISLRPKGRALRWKPGQFAFVSAPDAGMAEPHPFTIASAPRADGRLDFDIKALGDWTHRLPMRLAPGQAMRVEGPYGRFVFRKRVQRQVWLAGGIGITPFLAWAEALTPADAQQIVLVWSVSQRSEAFATERLQAIAERHPGLTVHLVVSAEAGRLTAQTLTEWAPFPMRDAELFYCGPRGLLHGITQGLDALKQSPRRIHQEAFELR